MKQKIKAMLAGYVFAVIAAGTWFYFFGRNDVFWLIDTLKGLGVSGAILFSVIFICGTLIFFPITLLAFVGGVLYGAAGGFVVAMISSTTGACTAFLLSRYICHDWIKDKIAQHEKLCALREDVSKNGWKIVVLSHFNFILPYTALNYAFGLTRIPFSQYALVTFAAMIPCNLLYAYLGAAAGTIAAYFQSHRSFSPVEIIFSIITLAATVTFFVYFGILAKKYFRASQN